MLVILIVLFATAWCGATPGHEPFPDPITPDSPNAAGRYLWLQTQITVEDQNAAGWVIDEARLDAWTPAEYVDEELMAPEQWRSRLLELQPVIVGFIEASTLRRFDLFASPELNAGPFPDGDPRRKVLTGMRRLAMIARDDAVRCWVEGDRLAAVERVGASLRAAAQLRDSRPLLIYSLVAARTMEQNAELASLMATSTDDPRVHERIRAALGPVAGDDPTGVRAAWRAEYAGMRDWIGEQLEPEDGGLELWIALGKLSGFNAMLDSALDTARDATSSGESHAPDRLFDPADVIRRVSEDMGDVTSQDLRNAYALAKSAGDEVLATWDGTGSAQELAAMERANRILKSDETYVASLMGLFVNRLEENNQRVMNARDEAIAALPRE